MGLYFTADPRQHRSRELLARAGSWTMAAAYTIVVASFLAAWAYAVKNFDLTAFDNITFLVALVLAIGPILGPYVGKDIVRQRRAAMIERFEIALRARVQACEFVKYKYLNVKGNNEKFWAYGDDSKESALSYIISSFPLCAIIFILSYYSISFILLFDYSLGFPTDQVNYIFNMKWMIINDSDRSYLHDILIRFSHVNASWVLVSSFVAAYINMWYNFMRALRNYEFHSLDCVESFIDMFLSVFMSLVFYYTFDFLIELLPFAKNNSDDRFRLPAAVLFGVAISCYPDVIRRYIINFTHLRYVKVEKTERFNSLEIIPVEVIDGIDTNIRKRLEDYHIVSVQNLATSNPVMLFVETPFAIYELVDWVAQAQLITAIGIQKTNKLWGLGIRTILDLKHYTLNSKPNEQIIEIIARIVLDDAPTTKFKENQTTETARAFVEAITDSPHAVRLIQLAEALRRNLGNSNFNVRVGGVPVSGQKPSPRHKKAMRVLRSLFRSGKVC